MWFWLWVVLVVGALAAAAVVLRDTWRRLTRTGRALGETLSLADRFSARVGQARAEGPVHPVRPVTVFDGLEEARRYQHERVRARARRRAERRRRWQERWDEWGRFNR